MLQIVPCVDVMHIVTKTGADEVNERDPTHFTLG